MHESILKTSKKSYKIKLMSCGPDLLHKIASQLPVLWEHVVSDPTESVPIIIIIIYIQYTYSIVMYTAYMHIYMQMHANKIKAFT